MRVLTNLISRKIFKKFLKKTKNRLIFMPLVGHLVDIRCRNCGHFSKSRHFPLKKHLESRRLQKYKKLSNPLFKGFKSSLQSRMVRVKGLEPHRRRRQILSLVRLPISPHPHSFLTSLTELAHI